MVLDIDGNIMYRKAQGPTYDVAMQNLIQGVQSIETDYKVSIPKASSLDVSLELSKSGVRSNAKFNAQGSSMEEILASLEQDFGIKDISLYDHLVRVSAKYELSEEVLSVLTPKPKSTPAGPRSASAKTEVFM